ncbi:MAG: hypothetical protein HZB92_08715 [Euryarchaeota archaeon]|nr:hypothetical protein [Euryarchaeota archaeon]
MILEKILAEYPDILDEFVLTKNMSNSLEQRMLPEHFKRWSHEKEMTDYQTVAKTFKNQNGKYVIVVLMQNGIENYFRRTLAHELTHVVFFVQRDKYLLDKEFSNDTKKKIDSLFNVVSEYVCTKVECEVQPEQEEVYDNIETELKRLVNIYKSLLNKDENTFQRGIQIALAEFNCILIRHLGYCDGNRKETVFDEEISSGIVFSLFEDSLIKRIAIVRTFSFDSDIVAISNQLYEAGNEQIDTFNKNIPKFYSKS